MSEAYRSAVQARKQGDAALARGDVKEALMYYRRALAALRRFKARAQGRLKLVAEKAIKSLERDIARLESRGREREGAPRAEARRPGRAGGRKASAQPAAAAGEWSGDLSDLPEECGAANFQIVKPDKTFDDLAGMEKLKEELRLAIELPLKYPEEFKRRGIDPKTGILLYGPPGCGKTYMVSCAGGQFGLPVIIAKADQLVDSYVGNTEKNVAQVFRCARATAPSILLVDEIDTLLPAEKRGSDVMARAEGVFLQELSGVASTENVQTVFMGATNKPWDLNPALIRPGRIDRIIYVPPPDEKAREEIFRLHLRGNRLEGIDFKKLARMTAPKDGYSYSSSGIAQVCETAIVEVIKEQYEKGVEDMPVRMEHIETGLSKVPRSITPEMERQYEEFAEKFSSFKA